MTAEERANGVMRWLRSEGELLSHETCEPEECLVLIELTQAFRAAEAAAAREALEMAAKVVEGLADRYARDGITGAAHGVTVAAATLRARAKEER